jgi:hypothetical protein
MLNDRSELHGSCPHTAGFHWLFMWSGTDDWFWMNRMKASCGVLVYLFTPRYRSEAEGEGLRGPFFICRSVDLYRFTT